MKDDPIDPATRALVDRMLASRAAHPEHDMACLLCGATYVAAVGHVCEGVAPRGGLKLCVMRVELAANPKDGFRKIGYRVVVGHEAIPSTNYPYRSDVVLIVDWDELKASVEQMERKG